MPVATINPTTVSVDAFNPYKASALFGGDTALSDSSDATFAEVWTSVRPGVAVADHIHVAFPTFPGIGVLNSASLIARVEYAVVNGTELRFDMEADRAPDTYIGTFFHDPVESGSTVPSTGTIYTLTDWTFTALADAASALTDGLFVMAMGALSDGTSPPSSGDWMLRVYELALVIDYTPLSFVAPACQLYPRNDHLGVGAGAVWPPPSSQQAGMPGGYY